MSTTTKAAKARRILATIERATSGAAELADAFLIAELLGLDLLVATTTGDTVTFSLTDRGQATLPGLRVTAAQR